MPAVAEIKYPTLGFSLYGVVKQMNQAQMTVQLQVVPGNRKALETATPAEMLIVLQGTLRTAPMLVTQAQGDLLTLQFAGAVEQVQRRTEFRHDCALPASFREQHDTGCAGAWQSGMVRDISLSGLKLEIEPTIAIPKRIELMFKLSEENLAKSSSRAYGDEGLEIANSADDRALIRASARVCHSRAEAHGNIGLGLFLTRINAADKLRLARFLSELSTS